MNSTLRAFLSGLLDYAGLFPPAGLPMQQALEHYLTCREHSLRAMLGRFILPVARLGEFEQSEPFQDRAERWTLSLLGTALDEPVLASARAASDLEEVGGSLGRYLGDTVTVDAVEVAVAPALAADPRLGEAALAQRKAYQDLGRGLTVYYELPLAALSEATLRALDQAGAGLKIRTGGVTADRFPSAPALAAGLELWGRSGLPLKATAGLHRPLPHLDTALGARHHGFVNLFVGAMLARRFGLTAAELQGVLEAEDPRYFEFGEHALRAGKWSLDLTALEQLRLSARGFGSCSFLEPVETLAQQGFLAASEVT